MTSFLTLEDINTTLYSHQEFYWHTIDLTILADSDDDFDYVKVDFCEIKREKLATDSYKYSVKVNNSHWTNGIAFVKANGDIDDTYSLGSLTGGFTATGVFYDKLLLYIGNQTIHQYPMKAKYLLKTDKYTYTHKQLKQSHSICLLTNINDNCSLSQSLKLNKGYNLIKQGLEFVGYILVDLQKTDFQYTCNPTLTINEINKVPLGTDTDYKPNGDQIGTYEPVIEINYGPKRTYAYWDNTENDYCFDLDLTDKTEPTPINITITVHENEVINTTETSLRLNTTQRTITTQGELRKLFRTGGVGILGGDITLTADIDIFRKDAYLKGDNHTVNLNGYNITVPTGRTFKATDTTFSNGVNCIHQKTDSAVILDNCTFTDCTGLGSCIECDIELQSLSNPTDFGTKITNTTFTNNDTPILHGGDLTVQNCTVDGKIGDPNYPYFLYQTDGTATLLQNNFSITNDTTLNYDLEFNSCIFICGETALVNGLSHEDLQRNNIETFNNQPQNNQSSINVSYYYDLIEDNITLTADNGYCHSVSDVDFVFKSNVNITRSE